MAGVVTEASAQADKGRQAHLVHYLSSTSLTLLDVLLSMMVPSDTQVLHRSEEEGLSELQQRASVTSNAVVCVVAA
jgi:hypothetical protein